MQSRVAWLMSMEWLTYERKRKIILVMTVAACISCAVGVVGMYFTAEIVAQSTNPSTSATLQPGPFIWPVLIGVGVILAMLSWYHTISKRRPSIKAGTYRPING